MRGREGIVPKADFILLVQAVESFNQINQVNNNVVHLKALIALINAVCGIELLGKEKNSINLCKVGRHIRSSPHLRWLMQSNLELWRNGWKAFLVEMGFATRDASSGKVFKSRISELPLSVVVLQLVRAWT